MEEIGEMIGKGFGIWRQNLNLCIPFLLNFFVSILVLVSFLAVIFVVAMPLMDVNSTSIQNSQNLQDVQAVQDLITQMEEALRSLGWQTILMVAFLFFGMIAYCHWSTHSSWQEPSAWPGRLWRRAKQIPVPCGPREEGTS